METEVETQPLNCCSPSKIQLLLVFVSRRPSALPASSVCFASLASLALLPG